MTAGYRRRPGPDVRPGGVARGIRRVWEGRDGPLPEDTLNERQNDQGPARNSFLFQLCSPRACALTLALLLTIALAAPGSGQVRPEVTFSTGTAFGFDGDALGHLSGDLGVGIGAGIPVSDVWRIALLGRWSSHGATTTTSGAAELWTAAGELLWRPRVAQWKVRPHLGVRGGLGKVDQETSEFAVLQLDLLPGARIVASDTGPFLAPVAGVRVPLSGRLAVEVDGTYGFYDLDPVVVDPSRDPGWSRGLSLEASVVVGILDGSRPSRAR